MCAVFVCVFARARACVRVHLHVEIFNPLSFKKIMANETKLRLLRNHKLNVQSVLFEGFRPRTVPQLSTNSRISSAEQLLGLAIVVFISKLLTEHKNQQIGCD